MYIAPVATYTVNGKNEMVLNKSVTGRKGKNDQEQTRRENKADDRNKERKEEKKVRMKQGTRKTKMPVLAWIELLYV